MTNETQQVFTGERRWHVDCSEGVAFLDSLPADSVSLVLGSPPYCDARTYGIDAVYNCEEWVEFMLKFTAAAVRVSTGLVLWVAAGVQRDLCYWPACEGLMWEWWKRGNQLWRPCVWWKVDENDGGTGIPGSGGKQWLRNDWEYVMAFKREGWLPWADPLVMGHAPVYSRLGGKMSNRTADGRRATDRVGEGVKKRRENWGGDEAEEAEDDDPWQKRGRGNNLGGRTKDGRKNLGTNAEDPWNHGNRGPGRGGRRQNGEKKGKKVLEEMDAPAGTNGDGTRMENTKRPLPKIANPGNVVRIKPGGLVVKARVGGGHIGDDLAHENEAPYPEKLADFFIRSFAAPGSVVCDPFSGSGTTAKMAVESGRRFVGCDIRQSQVDLAMRRMDTVTPTMFV